MSDTPKTESNLRGWDVPGPFAEFTRELERELAAAEKLLAENEALRKFAQRVMECWPDGDVDGGELQDAAITAGLLQENNRTTTCGEDCRCSEYFTEAELAEGFVCYTKTPLLTDAAPDAGKGEKEG